MVLFAKNGAGSKLFLLCTCLLHGKLAGGAWNSSSYFIAFEHEDPCHPEQVHLSFGATVSDITVMWATLANCPGQVKYGKHSWGLEEVSTARETFFYEYNGGGVHYLHKAELKNLAAETTYYYIPISNRSQAGPFYFKTPRVEGNWSPNFLMFGDLGIYSDTIPTLVNEALTGEYTALFHVGDLAYDLKAQDGLVGDHFLRLIEPAASAVPYLTCPGNHEIDFDSFAHYRHRFTMPDTEWPIPLNKMWYSIDIGPVHFVSYSTEVFFTNFAMHVNAQREWLIKDLEKANKNRLKVPWVIAFGHRPMYCSTHIGDDCSQEDSRVRNGLEEIFYKMSVDIVVQGHEHNYERLWPVYKSQVTNYSYINPSAPVQLISGAAGSQEQADHFPTGTNPTWSAFRSDDKSMNSYGRMQVVNRSHVFWEQRSMFDHNTLDSIWIVKERDAFEFGDEAQHLLDQVCPKSFLRCHPVGISVSFASLLVFVIVVLAIRFVLKRKRQKLFANTWNRLPDEGDGEEEETFMQL